MIRRNKKTRKYHSPQAAFTSLMLESNFCESLVRFDVTEFEVVDLDNESNDDLILEF